MLDEIKIFNDLKECKEQYTFLKNQIEDLEKDFKNQKEKILEQMNLLKEQILILEDEFMELYLKEELYHKKINQWRN